MRRLENPFTRQEEKRRILSVFLIAAAIATVLILPFMIYERGYFFYYGDFNVQQVPFIQYASEAIKSGNTGWSWTTDLGSQFIGSYSFYLLGSPFFWLQVLFPSAWTPALTGPVLILKMAVAAVGGYLYIRRFVKNRDYAVIGALLYAFSSYTIYNIFFNHFIDVVALFPFLMIAFDELVENGRWGVFAFMTAISLFNNYFFFIGEVIFLILYYIFRVTASNDWKFDYKRFGRILLEGIIGAGVTAVMMVPTVLSLAANPRLDGYFSGWGFFSYDKTQRYLDVFQSILFPPELPHFDYFIPSGDTRWQSVAAWLPLVSLSLVIAFMISKKSVGTWQKRILIFSGIAIMVPGLASMFYLFKATYYSRWLYMAVLVMALVSAKVLEDGEESHEMAKNIHLGFKWSSIFTLALFIPIALIPTASGSSFKVGLYSTDGGGGIMFWVCSAIAIGCIVVFGYLLHKFYRKRPQVFKTGLLICLSATICIYGLFILVSGKTSSQTTQQLLDDSVYVHNSFTIPGEKSTSFYRIDVLDGMDNQGLYWKLPSINFFHSTVSPSIMKFYTSIGVERSVASRPGTDKLGLRPLLSVKYIFETVDKKSVLALPNVTKIGTQDGYDIYRNNDYIPFGFTYSQYTTKTEISESSASLLDQLMLAAIVLDDKQSAKYGSYLTKMASPTNYDPTMAGVDMYAKERSAYSCYNFTKDKTGFSAQIDLPSTNLVFFSLPHEKGWTATVNGITVPVEDVNYGMSAVLAQAGHDDIRFTYVTPGLSDGKLITAGCLVLMIGLFAYGYVLRRKTKTDTQEINEFNQE